MGKCPQCGGSTHVEDETANDQVLMACDDEFNCGWRNWVNRGRRPRKMNPPGFFG